jgi:negative regulator of flagellin synthesis FlgM
MMKIDSTTNRPILGDAAKATARPAAGKSAAAGAAREAVQLSDASTRLASGSEPTVDMARVQEIRQAIAEGRFQINASAIADNLIATARDLVQQHHPV